MTSELQFTDNDFTSQAETKNFGSAVIELTGGLQEVEEGGSKGANGLNALNCCWVVDGLCTCTPVNRDDVVVVVVQQGVGSSFDEGRRFIATPAVRNNADWPSRIVWTVQDRIQVSVDEFHSFHSVGSGVEKEARVTSDIELRIDRGCSGCTIEIRLHSLNYERFTYQRPPTKGEQTTSFSKSLLNRFMSQI